MATREHTLVGRANKRAVDVVCLGLDCDEAIQALERANDIDFWRGRTNPKLVGYLKPIRKHRSDEIAALVEASDGRTVGRFLDFLREAQGGVLTKFGGESVRGKKWLGVAAMAFVGGEPPESVTDLVNDTLERHADED